MDTAVIMLDGQAAFNQLNRANFDIWWGAYLGMPEQLLIRGHLCDVADEIRQAEQGSGRTGLDYGYISFKTAQQERTRERLMAQKHIFIFGLGYVGQHLPQPVCPGWQITGTTRAPEKLKENVPANWQIVQFDTDTPVPDLAAHLSSCSHLLTTISPLSGFDPVMTCHKEEISDFIGWSGYVSATSVYPDQGQGFVDETVMPAPATQEAATGWRPKRPGKQFVVQKYFGSPVFMAQVGMCWRFLLKAEPALSNIKASSRTGFI